MVAEIVEEKTEYGMAYTFIIDFKPNCACCKQELSTGATIYVCELDKRVFCLKCGQRMFFGVNNHPCQPTSIYDRGSCGEVGTHRDLKCVLEVKKDEKAE